MVDQLAAAEHRDWLGDLERRKRQEEGPSPEAAKLLAKKVMTCNCPMYCKYCGAKLRLDAVGHYCPTRNCQWRHGVSGCTGKRTVR